MLYKVTIDAVDGESFFAVGGSDKAMLLRFLDRYDHEGSTVTLSWCTTLDDGTFPNKTDDPERIYRILAGQEEAPVGDDASREAATRMSVRGPSPVPTDVPRGAVTPQSAADIAANLELLQARADAIQRKQDAHDAFIAAGTTAPLPQRILRNDDRDQLDDVAIGPVDLFRMERMDRNVWWMRLTMPDGEDYIFHVHGSGRTVDVTVEVEKRDG